MIKNRRAVLRAGIVSLPVQCGWIVDREKYLKDFAIRNYLRVERHAHRFGMASVAIANLFIGWVRVLAAGVTRLDRLNALQIIEDRFEAPEATAAECRDFSVGT